MTHAHINSRSPAPAARILIIWACVKTYPHHFCIKQPDIPNVDVFHPSRTQYHVLTYYSFASSFPTSMFFTHQERNITYYHTTVDEQRGEDEPGTYRERTRNVPGTYQDCIMLPRWPILRVFLGPDWGILMKISVCRYYPFC